MDCFSKTVSFHSTHFSTVFLLDWQQHQIFSNFMISLKLRLRSVNHFGNEHRKSQRRLLKHARAYEEERKRKQEVTALIQQQQKT